MCLTASKTQTKKLQKKKGKLTVYKVYVRSPVDGKDSLNSPHYCKGVGSVVSGPGEIVSSRLPKQRINWKSGFTSEKGGSYVGANISEGIHAYLDRKEAEAHAIQSSWPGRKCVVLEMDADYSELLGVAPTGDESSHAVFRKVNLPEDSWFKVFPKTSKDTEKVASKPKVKAKAKKAK